MAEGAGVGSPRELATVKARALIEQAAYGPEQVRALCAAFDGAWEAIADDVDDRSEAIEASRLKLANLILGLARDGNDDAEWLMSSAVRIMRASLGK
jgi:hypothetical protein